MKKFTSKWLMLILTTLLTVTLGSTAFAYDVKMIKSRFSATCGEAITIGEPIAIKDADGEAYAADANDATLRPAVGVATKGCAENGTVEIATEAILTGWSSLSEGGYGYLSETAGAITQSAPTYAQVVGIAISTTDYLVSVKNYQDTSSLTALGTLSGATPIIFEGATADAFETTINVEDPTADNDIYLPDDGGMLLTSTLTTNGQDVVNSVWGGTNQFIFEGATADAFETILTPQDATADATVTIPDDTGTIILSTLATNGQDIANSIWGGTNAVVMEGATADGFETSLSPEDPTADNTITLPDDTGTVITSTLATNGQDVVNSVWGGTNGVIFEGATADAYETTVSPVDPTADRTISLPDVTGTLETNTLEVVTAANVLTAAECGKTMALNSGTEFQTTLPAMSTIPANGCRFKFIIQAAASGANYTVITGNSLENLIYGNIDVNSTNANCAAEDTITFVDGNAIGDYVEVYGDGTYWYIEGLTPTAAKLTCTQAD